MTPCHEIRPFIAGLEYETIRNNKKIEYINLPCGFDIETTSYKEGETKSAFMYIWALGIGQHPRFLWANVGRIFRRL